MARETNETNFTLLLRRAQGLKYPIRCVALLWIVDGQRVIFLCRLQQKRCQERLPCPCCVGHQPMRRGLGSGKRAMHRFKDGEVFFVQLRVSVRSPVNSEQERQVGSRGAACRTTSLLQSWRAEVDETLDKPEGLT